MPLLKQLFGFHSWIKSIAPQIKKKTIKNLNSEQSKNIIHLKKEKTLMNSYKIVFFIICEFIFVTQVSTLKASYFQVMLDSGDCRDRTVRFTAEDACKDVTQSCTVNIGTDSEPQAPEQFNFLPNFGEKTVKLNANDTSIDVTRK